MASRWDDEFDFDDLDPKPAAKKKEQKKAKKDDYDFSDLDDDPPAKNKSKLPVIENKRASIAEPTSAAKPKNSNKMSNLYDDYEELGEEIEEINSPIKPAPKINPTKYNKNDGLDDLDDLVPVPPKRQQKEIKPKPVVQPKKAEEDQQYLESLEEIESPAKPTVKAPLKPPFQLKPAVTVPAKPASEPQEEYEEEAFDDYGDDFEEEVPQPPKAKPKEVPKKSYTEANLKPKGDISYEQKKLNNGKTKLNTNKIFSNKESNAPKPPSKPSLPPSSRKKIEAQPVHSLQKGLKRNDSRRSIKSNDSRRFGGNSRVTTNTNKKTAQMTAHKHMNMVEQRFGDSEDKVGRMANDKVTKVNDQIREMIRKFNDQLNEMINKNMVMLKDRSPAKAVNLDNKIRVMEEQLKSGSTAEEVVENQLERLRGRQGQLREEEYLLILEKRTEDIKEQMKETSKIITRLKVMVNSEGSKLARQQYEKKMAQELHQIKLMLMQTRKEEDKNTVRLEKLEKTLQELDSKNSDAEYNLSQQIDTAKQKGVVLNVSEEMRKKFENLKGKIAHLQQHKKTMEGLGKSKGDHIGHEIDQARNHIKGVESQINNVTLSIDRVMEDSITLINKAKENPKISHTLSDNLDRIKKSIEESQAINFYEIRTEGNKSQASQRPLKRSMYQNLHKEQKNKQSRNGSIKKNTPLKPKEENPKGDEINLMKPNFMKKKPKATEQSNQEPDQERIWREEEAKRQQEEKRKKEQQKRKSEERKRLEAQENSKKPFTLKKNRLKSSEPPRVSDDSPTAKAEAAPAINLDLPVEPKEEEKAPEKPSIGPKFMRLNRKDKERGTESLIPSEKKVEEEIAMPVEPKPSPPKEEEDQPAFLPRRMNLRNNRLSKKDDGYTPSVERSVEQPKKEEPKNEYVPNKIMKEDPKDEYVPRMSFKDEEPIKVEEKKPQPEIKIDIPEEKPRFNLRLRDRTKKNNDDDEGYMPTRLTQPDSKKQIQIGNSRRNINLPQKDTPFNSVPKDDPIPAPLSQKQNINNPYAPQPAANNSYAPKPAASNPYAPAPKEETNNPYAPKDDAPKKEKEGPVKKIKIQKSAAPKEKISIFDQAEDITQPAGKSIAVNDPVPSPPKAAQASLMKTDQLDLNAMLGIKKKEKGSDLDDLLGDIAGGKKKERRKKNDDFFNDLEL